MSLRGMDVEAVRVFARQLDDAAARLDAVSSDLTHSLYSVDWVGADAETARADWQTRHLPLLTAVGGYLRGKARALWVQADEQAAASEPGVGPVRTNAPVPPSPERPSSAEGSEPKKQHGFWNKLGHGALDVAGLVPVVGEPADGVNAVWYAAEGDEVNAALSAAGMIPIAGWGATGAKAGIKTADALKGADEAIEGADAAKDTARALPHEKAPGETEGAGSGAPGSEKIPSATVPGPVFKNDVEQASFDRFRELPQFAQSVFRESPDPRLDWIDDTGRTYDQMGNPKASENWLKQRNNFLAQIDRHLGKADTVVLDLTGFAAEHVGDVRAYLTKFDSAQQTRIVRIGF